MTEKQVPAEYCNVAYALTLVGGKWKLAILWKLMGGRRRYAEIRRALPGISEPVLIAQLKQLERDGLIKRIDYRTVPPHVEYQVTQKSRALHKALQVLDAWGLARRRSLPVGVQDLSK